MTLRVVLAFLLLYWSAPAIAAHKLRLHWVKRDDAPTVFLIDQTGGRFPVREAADRWNAQDGIRFQPVAQCPAHRGCVTVRGRAMDFLGVTTLHHDRTHIKRAVVDLSSTRAMSAAKRLSVTCHELGHALGLGHRGSTSSCLFNGNAFPPRPDRHDLAELGAQYAHAHR